MYEPFQEILNSASSCVSRPFCHEARVIGGLFRSLVWVLSLAFKYCGTSWDDRQTGLTDRQLSPFPSNIKHNCRFIKAQRMAEKLCWSHVENMICWEVWWAKVSDATSNEGVVTKLKSLGIRACGHCKMEWVEQVAEGRNKQKYIWYVGSSIFVKLRILPS